MREIKPNKFVMGVLGCFPLLTLSAGSSTQPVSPALPSMADVPVHTPDAVSGASDNGVSPPTPDDAKPHRADGAGSSRGRGGQRNQPPVSQSDIDAALKFYQEHSLNRYTAIQNMPKGDSKNRVTETAARYYLSLIKLQSQDPKLYDLSVQRVGVEDKIFDLVTQIRNQPSNNPDPALLKSLHDQVAALVDLGIQERQQRLDDLKKTIDDQQKQLDADRANPDKLIQDRLKNIENERNGLLANPATPAGTTPSRSRNQPHDGTDNH